MSSYTLIHEAISQRAAAFPRDVAVVCENVELSYGELNGRSDRLAAYLRILGVGPDHVVAILLDRSIDMVVVLLAIWKAGGAYMPLDPSHPADRQAAIIALSDCRLAITKTRYASDLPSSIARVLLDRDAGLFADGPPMASPIPVSPDHISYVLFTSGSTGTPKGSMIPHRGLANLVAAQHDLYDVHRGSRVLQFARFAFDAATWDIATTLSSGATLCLMPAHGLDDAGALGRIMREQRITTAMLPPAILPLLDPAELPDLERLIVGGDVLSSSSAARWVERVDLINAYGPTEASICATFSEIVAGGHPAIGRPIDGVATHVLDEDLTPVAPSTTGALYIAGEGLARGYLRQPGLTAERFLPNPFGIPGSRLYSTGDLVRVRADGQLEFVGRADRQVKVRGFRIELGEIEAALLQCTDVVQAAVAVSINGQGHPGLVAHLEGGSGRPLDRSAILAELRTRLPDYMVPANLIVHDRLPLTDNGKIDRTALPERSAPTSAPPAGPGLSDIEQRLMAAWARAFKSDEIAITSDFFELGGDSIMALRIVSQLRQQGIQLAIRDIYEHRTIAALARQADCAPEWVEEMGPELPLSLSPIQRWFFDRQLANPHRFNQSCLLECRERIEPDHMQRALNFIFDHHAAFTIRFESSATGWRPLISETGPHVMLEHRDLGPVAEADVAAALADVLDDLHRQIHISDGPLCRAALIDLGGARGQRLYLVAHHLAVDLVSWRILIEDLRIAYHAIENGRAPSLPTPTLSYRQWAARLTSYPQSSKGQKELAFWRRQSWPQEDDCPVDYPGGANLEGDADSVEFDLDRSATAAILRGVFGARVNDVLLAGLARAYGRWTGRRSLVVDLEGHGREDLVDGVDVMRTVGWFTSIFPVLLETGVSSDMHQLVDRVAATLAAIPHRGAGYGALRYLSDVALPTPRAPISFNYWGRLDDDISSGTLFGFVGQDEGERRDPSNDRTHLVEVNCHVVADRLHFQIIFSRQLHRRESVVELVAHLSRALNDLAQQQHDPQPQQPINLGLIDMEVE